MENNEIMTRKEVLQYLRISHQTLYNFIEKEGFPVIKMGDPNKRGTVRYRRSDIDEWLLNRTRGDKDANRVD